VTRIKEDADLWGEALRNFSVYPRVLYGSILRLSTVMAREDRERARLAQLYALMTDGELQKVASDGASLTDIARQALAFEISRRTTNIEVDDEPDPIVEPEFHELVTIAQFRDLPAALLAKGSLDSAGIESFLADENMVRMDWFISNLLGGIRLKVRPQDAGEANAILSEPVPQAFEVEGVGEYQQPACPKCESVDVTHYSGQDERAIAVLWAVSVPLPFSRNIWKCEACGNQWQAQE
jgi:hypothetical protein